MASLQPSACLSGSLALAASGALPRPVQQSAESPLGLAGQDSWAVLSQRRGAGLAKDGFKVCGKKISVIPGIEQTTFSLSAGDL